MTASPAAVQSTLATLRSSPVLFGPPGEPWADMMGRIATRTQLKTSIMPSNLQQTMTARELVDLVEYLTTLKTQTADPKMV